jgi:hypothetical protein
MRGFRVSGVSGSREAGRSTLKTIGCTCAALVVLALSVLAVLTWMTYREARSIKASFKDPATREAKTREVLPFQKLPAGYHALGSFSIPLIAKLAFFGDREPKAGEEPNQGMREHGFIYMSLRQVRDNRNEILRYLKGEAPEKKPAWISRNADFQTGEVIRRGTIDLAGTPVHYFASRGAMKQPDRKLGGLLTLLLADCPNDSRVRFGVWLGPDPAPDKPVAETDFKGTTADPEALKEFLGHFELCPAAR